MTFAPGLGVERADRDDPVAPHGHVGPAPGRAGAVDHRAAPEDHVGRDAGGLIAPAVGRVGRGGPAFAGMGRHDGPREHRPEYRPIGSLHRTSLPLRLMGCGWSSIASRFPSMVAQMSSRGR